MTAALEGGEWSAARPRRTLPPGKTRYPLCRRLGGPQGRSGRAENLAPPGFDPRGGISSSSNSSSSTSSNSSSTSSNRPIFITFQNHNNISNDRNLTGMK